jgi:hypothetical protein
MKELRSQDTRPQCLPKTRYRSGLWIFLIQSIHDSLEDLSPAWRAEPAEGFTIILRLRAEDATPCG